MRWNELGPFYTEHVRRAGGDPEAPSVDKGYEAFVATLAEPLEGLEGSYDDVLLFEVGRFRIDGPGGASGLSVHLDRRIFFGSVSEPEKLRLQWWFAEDAELAKHTGYDILGRGPGLPGGEGQVELHSFLAVLKASDVLARMRQLTPVRTRVWIESRAQ